MNIPYRTRQRLNRAGLILGIVVMLMIIAWFCSVIWLQRHVVYSRDGAKLDLELNANEIVGEVAVPPAASPDSISIYYNEGENAIDASNALTQLDGYFIDGEDLQNNIAGVWAMLEPLNVGTPIMIDLKGGYGSFYYPSNISEAIASQSVSTASVSEMITDMKESGFYMIARISAFRDYNYGLHHVGSGLMHVNGLGLWPDNGGCYWLNPTDPGVINWLISIVNELKELGFHEVVLTDFRFPESDMYRYDGTEEDKKAALVSAATSIATQCTTSRFCVSFGVTDPTFALPEGRTRIYLENVDATVALSQAAQATMESPETRLVFVANTNDTRYNDYGVLRSIEVAEMLEAQKAELAKKNNG